ncbi:hypothetical protein Rumeso_02654 [Rubellimicrobium mesophilum DSM 19309]|uniref:Uncharacterized protein n=1 Tax=Rubellimicrobium mesophilum DSM 19309 TaxID=442562 RepID=A0A017HN08_9RHOB|nr:hypothetical protein [Rubellimicrobium mesophilum]EYD75872.1 hypothetical protein Rumeso_02654 [Rubellimicrobium mesophilum DSM 19309]
MADASDELGVVFVDNPMAPDLFVDGVSGFFFRNGSVRITFHSSRAKHTAPPGPISNVVVGRLVMPVDAAEHMARQILEALERRRAEPAPSPSQASPKGH